MIRKLGLLAATAATAALMGCAPSHHVVVHHVYHRPARHVVVHHVVVHHVVVHHRH